MDEGEGRRSVTIIELDESDRLANHIPEDVWKLSRGHSVYIRDEITGELVQVLDCTGPECELEAES